MEDTKGTGEKEQWELAWQDCLRWAAEKDAGFAKRCEEFGIIPENIALSELERLPVQRSALGGNAFSRLTLPLSGISRILGKTTYLAEELAVWEHCAEQWLRSCGVTRATVLLIADGFSEDGPGWGMLRGANALKTTVCTVAERPWETVAEYGVTACALTKPLLEQWVSRGGSAGSCQAFFCLSNDLSAEERQCWQERLNVPIYRQIGLAGVQASAIAWECSRQQGYHWPLESFWPELIAGGELVVTALQRRSTTVIRLQTGIKGDFLTGLCPCGATWPRFLPSENRRLGKR